MSLTSGEKELLHSPHKIHQNSYMVSELQIKRDIEDNSEIIFSFLNDNVCCDPSLEPPQ